MTFTLHEQLKNDTHPIMELPCSKLLLMNNRSFPWVILSPKIDAAVELTDLPDEEYDAVMREVRMVAKAMQKAFSPYKLNIAALGNQVRQLHIHIIAREQNDAAWPNPVWGMASIPYDDASLQHCVSQIRDAFGAEQQKISA